MVLSPKGNHVRIYGKVDVNQRGMLNGFFGGIRIDWSKGTSNDAENIYKATPDNKLSTNKPFANPTAPAAPVDEEEEDSLDRPDSLRAPIDDID